MTEAFGAWRLDGVIAVGGMAEVWRASRPPADDDADGSDDGGDGNAVALKRLHTHLVRNADARAQFALEQRLACELPRHPHLGHGVEAGDVAGRPYVALALAPGDDLRRTLAANSVLPRARSLAIVIAACEAAAHLHDHGYAHGDINPGNLVVGAGDDIMLVDLGVARRLGEAGAVRGTHAYMAPEQVRGEAWTSATDVFALGVVLWELTCGKRLFHRGPPWLTMAAVVEQPAPSAGDPAIDAIARLALVKDPAHRLTSARALADQLRAL